MTSMEDFGLRVERTAARLQDAMGRSDAPSDGELLAELHLAVEELHVAHEELQVQQEELIAARAEIDAQRRRYQLLFATAPAALVVTDRDGLVKELNQAAGQLLAIDAGRVPTTSLISHIAADDRRQVRQALVSFDGNHDTVLHTRIVDGTEMSLRITQEVSTGTLTWLLAPRDGAPAHRGETRELARLDLVREMAADLAGDFDVIEMLTRVCDGLVSVIGIDACGVLLAHDRTVEVAAVSGADVQHVEFTQLQRGEGPCLEALRRGEPAVVESLAGLRARWPVFAEVCEQEGLRGVAAFPLPSPDGPLGTLNVFRRTDAGFAAHDLATCEAMARIVVLVLINARTVDDTRKMVDHLRHALESRIVIEQAKGVIAHDRQVGMGVAFDLLRGTARHRRVKLHHLAADVVAGRVQPADLG